MMVTKLLWLAAITANLAVAADYFPKQEGCFLLYDVKKQTFEKVINEKNCREAYPACSTFKVPLAVIAFDSGILKDENVVLKWDGKKDARPEVNRDHNAKTWIRDSVVWFSQRITSQLGKEKLQKYLDDFQYGNRDLSAGITQAWLEAPEKPKALKITAYEQVEFMKNLWTDKLPASKRAMQLTRDITYIETSPSGFRLNGKTGSNYYHGDVTQRLGWFVGHLQRDDREYIVVANYRDPKPSDDKKGYGGLKTRETTKTILKDLGLW